jgi:hypothetical protein
MDPMSIGRLAQCAPQAPPREIGGKTREELDELDQKVCSGCNTWNMCNIRLNRYNPKYHIPLVNCSIIKRYLAEEHDEPVRASADREPYSEADS